MDKNIEFLNTGGANPQVVYSLTVNNAGPDTVTGGKIVDSLSSFIASTTWSCGYTSGSASGAACGSGTGDINQSVTLQPGDVAVVIVT
jgi:hypothetical protein